MRATIKNYFDATKQHRDDSSDKGFSLIELIIVVVILGILVAVAIPIFGSIQTTARHNALEAAAANGATAVAAAIANNDSSGVASAAASAGSGSIKVTIATAPAGSTDDATDICVKAENVDDAAEYAQAGTATGCNQNTW